MARKSRRDQLSCSPIKIFWDPVARSGRRRRSAGAATIPRDHRRRRLRRPLAAQQRLRDPDGRRPLRARPRPRQARPPGRAMVRHPWRDPRNQNHETITAGCTEFAGAARARRASHRRAIVPCLHGRGGTGWLVFGAALARPTPSSITATPAWLPDRRVRGHRGRRQRQRRAGKLGPLEPVDGEAVMLKVSLAMGRNKTLRRRWPGERPPRDERTDRHLRSRLGITGWRNCSPSAA